MFFFLWLALALSGLQARGGSSTAAQNRASIEGVVVRAGSATVGAPQLLPAARVELNPGRLVGISNATGAFTFRNLPPGRYTISVSREGFVPQEDRRRGITSAGMSVPLAAGQALKDLVLPMVAAPALTGKVIDPFGQPAAAAVVRAYLRVYTPYGVQFRIVKTGMTDDLGEFRLFGLSYGQYLVAAAYGDRDRAALSPVRLSANVSKADEGYAAVFYDKADDISRAQFIRVAPDFDPGSLAFYFRETARFRIRGQVVPAGSGASIVLASQGETLATSEHRGQVSADGSFEVRGVSPGSYFLQAIGGDRASAVIPANVTDRDVVGLRLVLQPMLTLSGIMLLDNNVPTDLSGMHIKLILPAGGAEQALDIPLSGSNRSFAMEHVDPGQDYDIVIEPLPPGVYVKDMVAAGQSLLRGSARFAAGQTLLIVLSAAADGLRARVTRAGEAAAGAQVVLIPAEPLRRRSDRYYSAVTTETGDAVLTGVAPGLYTAYAFENIEPRAWFAFAFDPAVESRFQNRGVAVSIGGGNAKAIELKLIPAVETIGVLP
jgi:hypothetical protein